MTAILDGTVARAANAGRCVGVLVLVEKGKAKGGLAPLALSANLQTMAMRTQEVHESARAILLDPACRTDRPSASGLAPLAATRSVSARPGGVVLPNLGAVMAAVEPADLHRLLDTKGVRRVVAMPRLVPLVAPLEYRVAAPASLVNGPLPSLNRIGVPKWWSKDLQGQGVTVGHFDTGINGSHPAFSALKEQRRLRYAAFGADGEQIARARPKDILLGRLVFHGTHTAGTMVGDRIDKTQIGIAPRARLVSVQIFPQPPAAEEAEDQLVVNALNWIVGEQPLVLNLSFGDTRYNDSYLGVIRELVDQNIVVVAAVGNDGVGKSTSPGNYSGVVSVGAVDSRGKVCSFSGSARVNRVARPDLCAPGDAIISAGQGTDAAVSTGTSMAAPHVAGLIALARQRAPDLTPAKIKSLLKSTAKRPAGWDDSRGGSGILDGSALLSVL